ncbi:phage tail family protein [Streptomyces sp. LHD-70]|uniref:phage tail domain-containing protein n=1 Tax=Streptomyces sp. LHD-70 TaxID=3072140 RepID=UPI00280C576A|nr:phage tail domain-containing protein [Streptomyces sp. LHD-70]MDQ8706867.1 phage tail family protein [Streptomyces sp. LHD-70]
MTPKSLTDQPASVTTELRDWQIEIGSTVLLGPGTPIPVAEIEGLGAPEVRPQDVDNPIGDGTLPGADYYGPRTVRIEAGIKTPGDPAAATKILSRLQHAARAEGVRTSTGKMSVLRARWPGHETRRLYGRIRRMEATSIASSVHGWIPLDIEFVAMDPLFHADAPSYLTLGLDQAARPGRITNTGDAPAWPALRINGPVAQPKVWNTVTGQRLEVAVSLRAGEYVDLATRPGTRWALRNGATNIAGSVSPRSRLDHFTLPPGASEVAWSGDDPTATSSLTLSWRSAHTTL